MMKIKNGYFLIKESSKTGYNSQCNRIIRMLSYLASFFFESLRNGRSTNSFCQISLLNPYFLLNPAIFDGKIGITIIKMLQSLLICRHAMFAAS